MCSQYERPAPSGCLLLALLEGWSWSCLKILPFLLYQPVFQEAFSLTTHLTVYLLQLLWWDENHSITGIPSLPNCTPPTSLYFLIPFLTVLLPSLTVFLLLLIVLLQSLTVVLLTTPLSLQENTQTRPLSLSQNATLHIRVGKVWVFFRLFLGLRPRKSLQKTQTFPRLMWRKGHYSHL